jgi:EAL domain-containing protein (putative c-di-GMP-specific phosphodiesterase class I)
VPAADQWLTKSLATRGAMPDHAWPRNAVHARIRDLIGELEGKNEQLHRMAMDDFGTGYSSLAALELVRPDCVEIDRGFVQGLPHGVDDATLVGAMFGMADALGIEVVAEGVETSAQCDWRLQGWLWSRTVPATDFEARLRARAG